MLGDGGGWGVEGLGGGVTYAKRLTRAWRCGGRDEADLEGQGKGQERCKVWKAQRLKLLNKPS